jgi:hypothetical protein
MDLTGILALFPQLLPYVGYFTAAVTIANIVSTMLHPPKPDASKAYQWFYWGVHQCAMLRGMATPLNSPAATGIVGGLGAIQNPQMSTSSVSAQSMPGRAVVASIAADQKGTSP